MQRYRFTRTTPVAGRLIAEGRVLDESQLTPEQIEALTTSGAIQAVTVDPEADTDEFVFRDEEGQA